MNSTTTDDVKKRRKRKINEKTNETNETSVEAATKASSARKRGGAGGASAGGAGSGKKRGKSALGPVEVTADQTIQPPPPQQFNEEDGDDEEIIKVIPTENNATDAQDKGQEGQGQQLPVQVIEEEEEILEDDDVVAKPSQTIGREETKAILDTFDDITLNRYEFFRRAHLTKATMKKMVSNIVGPVPASVAIVVSGVGKIFVGEMVESALEIMDERGDTGPIAPQHLREAFRRYQKNTDTIHNKLYKPQIF